MTTVRKNSSAPALPRVLVRAAVEGFPSSIIRRWKAFSPSRFSAFTEADKPAYNALCLDDARNRFWGYDYREDWRGEPLEDYFLGVVGGAAK